MMDGDSDNESTCNERCCIVNKNTGCDKGGGGYTVKELMVFVKMVELQVQC